MIYGYIRVSTRDQNEDRQRGALKEYIRCEVGLSMVFVTVLKIYDANHVSTQA